MSENYDKELCEQIHKNISDQISLHNVRLNEHSGRLDKLEQRGASVDAQITSLCQQLQSLTTTLRWFIGILVGAFVSFFFYAIQNNILK